MIKHTNPFQTISEAVAALKNLGAKPYGNPFVYDESCIPWTEHILSVSTMRVYNDSYEYHFAMEIHIDLEGLNKLVEQTGLNILRESHSDELDRLVVHPGTLLKVYALGAKEAIS